MGGDVLAVFVHTWPDCNRGIVRIQAQIEDAGPYFL